MKKLRLSLLCVSALLLAGCSLFRPSQPCGTTTKTRLEEITKWNISGALAVKADHTGGNASFSWQQDGKQYVIELFGPFGINRVRLWGNPEQVTLFDGPGVIHTATTPEVLLQQQLGWSVPITHLLYWVRGLPVPHVPVTHIQKFPNGMYAQFSQQGWIVRYLDYTQIGCTLLPSKIFVQHPALQVRLVIRQWQIP